MQRGASEPVGTCAQLLIELFQNVHLKPLTIRDTIISEWLKKYLSWCRVFNFCATKILFQNCSREEIFLFVHSPWWIVIQQLNSFFGVCISELFKIKWFCNFLLKIEYELDWPSYFNLTFLWINSLKASNFPSDTWHTSCEPWTLSRSSEGDLNSQTKYR